MKTAYESYRAELAAIREAGTYKDERIITTPQQSRIDTTAARGVSICVQTTIWAFPTTHA